MTAAVADATTETTPVADGNTVVETEVAVDLTAFDNAVSNAISDGAPSEDEIKVVRKAYGDLEPRKGKSAARAKLDDDIKAAIQAGNLVDAQALFAVKDVIAKSGGLKGTRTAAPKNPTEAQVNTVLAIQLGYSLAVTNVGDGVDADWQSKVVATPELEAQANTYRTWLKNGQEGDEPEVPDSAKAGARISLGKAPKGQGRKPGKDKPAENPAAGALEGTPAVDAASVAPAADAPAAPEGWDA